MKNVFKIIAVLLVLLVFKLWFPIVVPAETQTINTVPSANDTFMTDLQTFLKSEDAQRAANSRVVSGGIGATDASLTHTISALTAYVEGYYVYDAAVSHTYTASKDTFVLVRADDTTTISIGAATITYDGNFIFVEMANGTAQFNAPAGTMMLFEAVTDATSITTVNDYRSAGIVRLSDPLFADGSDGRLADAVSTLSLPTVLVVDCDDAVLDDVTVPATIELFFLRGSILSPASTKTVTIYSPENIVAHKRQQIFGGAGSIVFTECGNVWIDWWQENTTPGTTDFKDAFTAAVASFALYGDVFGDAAGGYWTNPGVINLNICVYYVSGTVVFNQQGISVKGGGKYSTFIKIADGATFINQPADGNGPWLGLVLRDFAFVGETRGVPAANTIAVYTQDTGGMSIEDVSFFDLDIGLKMHNTSNSFITRCLFNRCNIGIEMPAISSASATYDMDTFRGTNLNFIEIYKQAVKANFGFLDLCFRDIAIASYGTNNNEDAMLFASAFKDRAATVFLSSNLRLDNIRIEHPGGTGYGIRVDDVEAVGTLWSHKAVLVNMTNINIIGGLGTAKNGIYLDYLKQATINGFHCLADPATYTNLLIGSNATGVNAEIIWGRTEAPDVAAIVDDNSVISTTNPGNRIKILQQSTGHQFETKKTAMMAPDYTWDRGKGSYLWDFSVDGGAIGAPIPMGILPKNAVITNAFADVIVVPTSDGAALIQIDAGYDDYAGIQSAAAISGAPWSTVGFKQMDAVDGTVANFSDKTTTYDRAVQFNPSIAALTGGKIMFFWEYIVSIPNP